MTENSDYGTVKIPSELLREVDKLIGTHGFKTRAELVKEALRKYLLDYKEA
jgi:metal-responsive CopG/Arc/MetJ family transcriptional regulator